MGKSRGKGGEVLRRRYSRPARTALYLAISLLASATVVTNRTSVAQAQRLEAVLINISVDGNERQLRTAQTTVGATLKEAGIEIGSADRVYPKPSERIRENLDIKIVRVVDKVIVEKQPLGFKTVRKLSTALRSGMTQVAKEGRHGEKHLVYSVKSEDGKVVQRKLLNAKVVRKPEDRVIMVGATGTMTSRGFIQSTRVLRMVATAYDPGPRSCGRFATGRTCTGMRAGYGVVAVDPRLIPLGSRLYVEGYGFAIAGDRGSAIKGHRIDLGHDTYHAAKRFGRKKVTVHVLK